MIDSRLVSLNFSRAASTYGQAAEFQRTAAKTLMEVMAAETAGMSPPRRILEIGCGTGFLTGLLFNRFPRAKFLITDISGRIVLERVLDLTHANGSLDLNAPPQGGLYFIEFIGNNGCRKVVKLVVQ